MKVNAEGAQVLNASSLQNPKEIYLGVVSDTMEEEPLDVSSVRSNRFALVRVD